MIAASATAGDLERRLAVLHFKANLVKPEEADIISERLRSEFVNQRNFVVVDRKNMETILKEQQVQLIDCTETECAIQMGEILNVRWIVLGSLSQVEGDYFMTAELVDVQTAQVRCSVNRMGQRLKDLFKIMPDAARELGCTSEKPVPIAPPIVPQAEPDRPYVAPLPVPTATGAPPTVRLLETPKGVMNVKDARLATFVFLGNDERCIEEYRYQLDDGEPVVTKRARAELAEVPRGSHVFQVQAKDCDGNYSEPHRFEFRVIDAPPSVRIVSPVSGERVRGTTLTVLLEGTDDGAIAHYRCAVNDPQAAVEQAAGTFSFEVAEGRQRIYAQAIDDGGSESEWLQQEVEFVYDDGLAAPIPFEAPEGFVAVPAGTFTMGSPPMEAGRDGGEASHEVTLPAPFFMQATEVTVAQWEAVLGKSPSRWRGPNRPVEQVTWFDAVIYCNRRSQQEGLKPCYYADKALTSAFGGNPPVESGEAWWDQSAPGYRLPTEAEWEYACRAGTTTAYPWGASMSGKHCWFTDNAGSHTHEVATTTANAWGLFDMNGNVAEWCGDWYGEYPSEAVSNPLGPPQGTLRVQRGGSWRTRADACRSASRLGIVPGFQNDRLGFRVVRNAR
jgi:formylglycine-generating enzyme required for sulfatase activity/TolB-like protein